MISPVVFWPSALGLTIAAAGICTYRRDLVAGPSHSGRFVALGPVFVAASLATFAGEHFTAARGLAQLVPEWMPARLFIAYFVGVALLAAALSLVAKRCVRWSAICLAIMFALFVLLLHLPNAVTHPRERIFWIIAVRESVFATGAWFLFASQARGPTSRGAGKFALVGRVWIAIVIVFYGIEHLLHPECSPGVPSLKLTPSWVPLPLAAGYITGIVLVLLGMAMLLNKYAKLSTSMVGIVMTVLTVALYFPDFFVVSGVSQQVTAINYIADTLLFAGTMLLVARGRDRREPNA